MTPEDLNAIANDVSVLPTLAPGYERIDISAFLKNPENIAMSRGRAVILFAHMGSGFYEAHLLFPQEVRGKEAIYRSRDMVTELFTHHGARAIYGSTPRTNRAARVFTRSLGFTNTGPCVDHAGNPCIGYRMTRDQWATLLADLSAA